MDQDLTGDKRVEAVTWALFDVSDPVVGDIMLSYQGDMPGDVM